jgi:hypothetical protein
LFGGLLASEKAAHIQANKLLSSFENRIDPDILIAMQILHRVHFEQVSPEEGQRTRGHFGTSSVSTERLIEFVCNRIDLAIN